MRAIAATRDLLSATVTAVVLTAIPATAGILGLGRGIAPTVTR